MTATAVMINYRSMSTQTPIQTRIIGPIPGLLLAMPQITRSASLQPGEREFPGFPSDAAASYVTWKIGTMQLDVLSAGTRRGAAHVSGDTLLPERGISRETG